MNKPIELKYRQQIDLYPIAPYTFDTSLHKPDHFPTADNHWEPGVRWQTLRWQSLPLGLKFENGGTIEAPCIHLSIWSHTPLDSAFIDSLRQEIEYRLFLHLDLSDFIRRFGDDPQLGPIIARWRGMRPLNVSSLYEYLMIAIVLQNATVRRTVSMMQALYECYGTPLEYDGQQFYCSWEAHDLDNVPEDELRALKVGYRAKSILRVSQAFSAGFDEIALRGRDHTEQRQALLGLYGVGPASAGYILSDVFHHLDEMDHISPWEQKIYSKLFFDADPEQPVPVEQIMELFNQRFSGYRSLAVHYIWEDLFWKRKNENVPWLEKLIRL
jgi:3-methyladenine DNA glycosylase/8-oxoguanine DNA glycosylase